ncbi:MAG: hypothetical protein IPF68_13370 [Bacteroidales bacterium]|nr:hypothetical protein [Bacteroidales bacterium]
MKKYFKILMLAAIVSAGLTLSAPAVAQTPPAPPATGGNNSGDNQIGGNAPIGGGVLLLITMGVGYAIKRVYSSRSEE